MKRRKKQYEIGMYGGKFMPFHKGHLYCLEKASELCNHVFLILFYGGLQEDEILKNDHREFLTLESRLNKIQSITDRFDNVIPYSIDVSSCRLKDGKEDWDAETPLVLNTLPCRFNVVFGSEPSYKAYFDRAYPWAKYILVDSNRREIPISATQIRNMKEEDMKKWII